MLTTIPSIIAMIFVIIKFVTASWGIQNTKEGEKKSNPSRIAKIIQKIVVIAAEIAMYFQLEKISFRLFVIESLKWFIHYLPYYAI